MRGLPPQPSSHFLLPPVPPLRIRNVAVSGHELSKSWMRQPTCCLPATSDLDLTPPSHLAVSGHGCPNPLRIRNSAPPNIPGLPATPGLDLTPRLRIRNSVFSDHELFKSWMRGAPPTFLLLSPAPISPFPPPLASSIPPFQATNCPNHGCEACRPNLLPTVSSPHRSPPLPIRNLVFAGHEWSKSWMRGAPPPTFRLLSPARISSFSPLPSIRTLTVSGHQLSKSWMRGLPPQTSVLLSFSPFQAASCPSHGGEVCPPNLPAACLLHLSSTSPQLFPSIIRFSHAPNCPNHGCEVPPCPHLLLLPPP